MFLKYRFWIVCATLALLLIFALMFLEWAVDRESPGILASYLLRNNGERQTISLPFSERQPDNRATYEYIVELVWKEGLHTRFQVVPDDYLESITVNGRLMPEVRYSGPGRSDYVNGLIVDFQSYLREGKNEIVFRILNHGGAYGMDIKGVQLQYSSLRIVALSLSILLVLALVFWVLRHLKVDRVLIFLVLLALIWQLISLAVRHENSYIHDLYEGGTGHLGYIWHIADKGELPSPSIRGWAYYHPPLYYIFGAWTWQFAKALDLGNPFKALHILALIFHWVFLMYSLRLLAQFVKQPWIYRVAAALLLFWPVSSLTALRIGNDVLLYPLFVASLFYAHRWFVDERWRDLLLASIVCGIGFFAKMNILPLACVLGVVVLWRLYRRYATLPLRQAIAALSILGVCFFFSAIDKWHYEFKAGYSKWYMIPFSNTHQHLNRKLFTDNKSISSIIIPDTKAWFDVAYISPWEDSKYGAGRESVWNFWGKTALFGQFIYPSEYREKYLAPFMNVSFVFLAALGLYGIPMFWRRRLLPYKSIWEQSSGYCSQSTGNERRRYVRQIGRVFGRARHCFRQCDFRFVFAVAVVLLLFSLISRIQTSSPNHAEFRLLVPLVPIGVAAVAAGLMRLQGGRRWLFVVSNILVICFALASFIFYFGI